MRPTSDERSDRGAGYRGPAGGAQRATHPTRPGCLPAPIRSFAMNGFHGTSWTSRLRVRACVCVRENAGSARAAERTAGGKQARLQPKKSSSCGERRRSGGHGGGQRWQAGQRGGVQRRRRPRMRVSTRSCLLWSTAGTQVVLARLASGTCQEGVTAGMPIWLGGEAFVSSGAGGRERGRGMGSGRRAGGGGGNAGGGGRTGSDPLAGSHPPSEPLARTWNSTSALIAPSLPQPALSLLLLSSTLNLFQSRYCPLPQLVSTRPVLYSVVGAQPAADCAVGPAAAPVRRVLLPKAGRGRPAACSPRPPPPRQG